MEPWLGPDCGASLAPSRRFHDRGQTVLAIRASDVPSARRSRLRRHGQNRSFDSAKTIKVRITDKPTAISTLSARAEGGFPVTAS